MIICKTPHRISFFGGGTDFPAWYDQNGGQVISATIDKYCYTTLRDLPPYYDFNYRLRYYYTETTKHKNKIRHPSIREVLKKFDKTKKGLEIVYYSDIPGKSGLGSSSAFTVSLLNLVHKYQKKKISKKKLATYALEIEQRVLKEHVGSQDQIIASYGGINSIKFNKNTFHVSKINFAKKKQDELEKNSFLYFIGDTRHSKYIERDKIDNIKIKKNYYHEISQLTKEAKKLFINSKSSNFLSDLGLLLKESWKVKKSLSNKVSNNKIDTIYDHAIKNGAIGGKVLGAGGGGFILFVTSSSKKKIKLKKILGVSSCLDFKITSHGSQIIYDREVDIKI